MHEASTSIAVMRQVLHFTPFRHLYIPGLYIALLGLLTLGHGVYTVFTHEDPGIYYKFLIWLVLLFGYFVSLVGASLCLVWLVFKGEQYSDPRGKQIVVADWENRTNMVLQSIIKSVPWRYACIPGLSLIALGILILAHTFDFHRAHLDAPNWDIMLHIHFRTIQGVALELAGLIACMGWYVFKSVDLEDREETQQRSTDMSNEVDGQKETVR